MEAEIKNKFNDKVLNKILNFIIFNPYKIGFIIGGFLIWLAPFLTISYFEVTANDSAALIYFFGGLVTLIVFLLYCSFSSLGTKYYDESYRYKQQKLTKFQYDYLME